MYGIELPVDARDAFFQTVWKIVRLVPQGQVTTYGKIAEYIPAPVGVPPEDYKANRAQWVGHAMAASPGDVPWQCVINSQGKISTRRGAETQRKQLEAEGVVFDARDRVDLKRYGWEGPDADWLRQNNLIAPDAPQQMRLI